jgi:hypothetical protein
MCVACKTNVHAESLDEFDARYLEILNHGALCLMISIGHRTGLFKALRSAGPCTEAQLADASRLNERYIREWLGAMVAGKIVEIEGGQIESGRNVGRARGARILETGWLRKRRSP